MIVLNPSKNDLKVGDECSACIIVFWPSIINIETTIRQLMSVEIIAPNAIKEKSAGEPSQVNGQKKAPKMMIKLQ